MARRKKEKLNEIEYLDKVNNLSDKEIEEIREQNQKHKDEISQRKVRNFISGLIKRIVDLIAGIVGTILLIPFTIEEMLLIISI